MRDQPESGRVDRRRFLKFAAMAAVGAAVTACGAQTATPTTVPAANAQPTAAPQPTSAPQPAAQPTAAPTISVSQAAPTAAPTTAAAATQKYNEAPQLADLVKAGTLPPVEKRLPTNPRVITPLQEVGQYSGT